MTSGPPPVVSRLGTAVTNVVGSAVGAAAFGGRVSRTLGAAFGGGIGRTLEGAIERAHAATGDALRTTRFLRGREAFVPRDDDVFVVTYPRSGTTWVQFILYLLRSDRGLDFDHISQISPWWERSLALGTRRAEDFENLPSPRVFKSHLPRRWLPTRGRFIHVERDGLDVAVSYHQLYRSHLGFDGDFEAFFERYLRGDVQYGSWRKHVEGWRQFQGDPRILYLSYGDLREDLSTSVRRIGAFLGWPVQNEAELVQMASFSFMKEHEARFDPITETLLDAGLERGRFLRRGESGAGRAIVSDAMRARFAAKKAPPRPDLELRLPAFLH